MRREAILGLHQTAGIVLRRDVMEEDVVWQRAEERDAVADEDRDTSDDEAFDEACAQEALNGDAAVDVEIVEAASSEIRDDLDRRTGHLLDDRATHYGKINGSTAEDDYPLFAIGPVWQGQYGLKSIAADDERIDAGHELVVAVRLASIRRLEVESTVLAGN
jgi:hypothetical protein